MSTKLNLGPVCRQTVRQEPQPTIEVMSNMLFNDHRVIQAENSINPPMITDCLQACTAFNKTVFTKTFFHNTGIESFKKKIMFMKDNAPCASY